MYRNKLECLPVPLTSTLVLYLWARLEPTRVEQSITRLHCNSKLLALPSNFKLRWKWMALANTLAYKDLVTITVVKGFKV